MEYSLTAAFGHCHRQFAIGRQNFAIGVQASW